MSNINDEPMKKKGKQTQNVMKGTLQSSVISLLVLNIYLDVSLFTLYFSTVFSKTSTHSCMA